MNKELQEHIKSVKRIISWDTYWENQKEYTEALKAVVSCAEELEAVKSASDLLPELPKKEWCRGCSIIAEVTPIHQKQVLRIYELNMARIAHMKKINELEQRLNSIKGIHEGLKASNELNKAELTRLKNMWETLGKIGKENVGAILIRQKMKIAGLEAEKQKEELDVGAVEKIIATKKMVEFKGSESFIKSDKEIAQAIVSRFSLGGVNKELLGALVTITNLPDNIACPSVKNLAKQVISKAEKDKP